MPLTIAQLSDLHCGSPHFVPDLMERAIAEINDLGPDIVVCSGDLTTFGFKEEYAAAKRYLDRIGCDAFVVIPGNHDSRNVGYIHFEELFGDRNSVLRRKGVTVVAVDSTEPDLDHGQIGHEVRRTTVQIRQLGDRQRHETDSRASEPGATLVAVVPETPVFQAYCGSDQPRFANPAELEYAKVLDWYGIPWAYEPTTFVLERDEQGRVVEAFTPDFYLPDQDLYLEVTVMKQSLVTRKNRKLRKLRQLYPEVKIKLFYERDFARLATRFGLQKAS